MQAPVRAQPQIVTQISEQVTSPGAKLTDTVRVTGLGGQAATIQAALYGPYPSREAIKCEEAPVWTGTLQVTGDGEYVTEPVTVAMPGYYTYRESIAESETIAAVQTACAEVAETTIVRGAPKITTQISAQESTPGAQITDSVLVSGLGKLAATVNVELWGPFPSREAMTCEGTPFWTGTFPATGDGTYTTAPATLARPATTPTASRSPPPRVMTPSSRPAARCRRRRWPRRRRRCRRSSPTPWSSPTRRSSTA